MEKERVKYSVIIPVYNRPEEVDEILKSLTFQSYKGFEVLIVEDGSTKRSDSIVDQYRDQLTLQYYYKPNTGPGPSRNYGFAKAVGEYFVVFDSDCIIPPTYFEAVDRFLNEHQIDAWGGPDQAHKNFTPLQQAMGYTMSSFLTTGGIRGGKKHVGWFQPRSFNMGISRKVFDITGGFKFDRLAEDIELSIRIKEAGFQSALIQDAFVYHKRRATLGQFYKQVFNFGRGRVLVGGAHPGQIKVTHWFPSVFTVGLFILPVLFVMPKIFHLAYIGYGVYMSAIGIDTFLKSKNIGVALLSIPAAIVQMIGYGLGFLTEIVKSYTK